MTESKSNLPEMTDVTSSNIASVGHNEEGLFVKFQSGVIWRYSGVSDRIYRDMLAAQSVGKFFQSAIKGKFEASIVPKEKT